MEKRRYVYLNGTEFKTFRSFKAMKEWAKDPSHDGKYFISCTNITFTQSRTDILGRK